MSDPADATNTMPLQKINWGGESLFERVKKVRQIQEIKRALKIEIHIHLPGEDEENEL